MGRELCAKLFARGREGGVHSIITIVPISMVMVIPKVIMIAIIIIIMIKGVRVSILLGFTPVGLMGIGV